MNQRQETIFAHILGKNKIVMNYLINRLQELGKLELVGEVVMSYVLHMCFAWLYAYRTTWSTGGRS